MSSIACTECNEPPASAKVHSQCAGCKNAYYCSSRCQKLGWPIHKTYCKQFTTLLASTPRPTPQHRLALLFPVDEKTPKLFWIECPVKSNENGQYEDPDYKSHIGTQFFQDIDVTEGMSRDNPAFKRCHHEHTVWLFVSLMSEMNGSPINSCIPAVMKGRHQHPWKGNLIMMSQAGLDGKKDKIYQDITSADVRLVTDFFTSYGRGLNVPVEVLTAEAIKQMRPDLFPTKSTIKGVIINCFGEIVANSKDEYTAIEISRDHAIFKDTHPSSASGIMGLPILVRKCNDCDPAWRNMHDDQGNGYLKNEFGSVLDPMLIKGCDEDDPARFDIGNLLVVGASGKDIDPQQVESLVLFATYQFANGNIEKLQALAHDPWGAQRAAEQMWNRKKFEEFFAECKKSKKSQDPRWKDTISPYDM